MCVCVCVCVCVDDCSSDNMYEHVRFYVSKKKCMKVCVYIHICTYNTYIYNIIQEHMSTNKEAYIHAMFDKPLTSPNDDTQVDWLTLWGLNVDQKSLVPSPGSDLSVGRLYAVAHGDTLLSIS